MNAASATVTLGEFARMLGCKRPYVTALRKADRLVLDESGRVLVAESQRRIESTRDPAYARVVAHHATARGAPLAVATAAAEARETDVAEFDDIANAGFQHWRERSERAKALAAERDNALAEDKLMAAGEVTRAVADAVTVLRTRLETLPNTLAPQLAALSDETRARELLTEEIEHALGECARALRAAKLADAAEFS